MKGLQSLLIFFMILLYANCSQDVSLLVGSTVTLRCPLSRTVHYYMFDSSYTKVYKYPEWETNNQKLSYGSSIFSSIQPDEFRNRLSITVNNTYYHLKILNLKKSDQGHYRCSRDGTVDTWQNLTVIVDPTSVSFENKENNKLQGTEGQDMRIRCTSDGGDPKPAVIIQIGIRNNGPEYSGTGGVVEHTLPAIDRSYDDTDVFCRTDYPGVQYQPRSDNSSIYLNLKPLSPIFKPDPISTEETKQLVLTCLSTGSRPGPDERIWLLGDSSMDITSSSTAVSQSLDSSKNTFVATSTLTYIVHKQYNGKSITCGFKNLATGKEFVKSSIQVDVKYAPVITVQNKTFEVTDVSRKLQCVLDGNPYSYSYNPWEHISKYGEHIRYLSSSQSLELPVSSENMRYQDTGEYICTANNGILNIQNQLDQKGSGYVISKASPMFLNGSSQILIGQIGSNVTIEVVVYSEPKVTELIWYKNGSQILPGNEYVMINSAKLFITTFHGVDIQVDGYTFSLTIMNIDENDFTNYTASISNNAGDPVEYVAELSPENDMKPLAANPAIGGIIGGIIAVLVAITLAVVGFVFCRRKTGTRPQGEPKSETNKALEEYENMSDNKNHSTVSQNRYDTLEMQRRVKSQSQIETNTYDEVGNDQQKNRKHTENKQDAQSNQNVYEDIKMSTKDIDANDRESRIYVNLVVW